MRGAGGPRVNTDAPTRHRRDGRHSQHSSPHRRDGGSSQSSPAVHHRRGGHAQPSPHHRRDAGRSQPASPTVHDARLHATRRLVAAWTDAFVLFPVRDLDLLARATPAVMRVQPPPTTFPQLLDALRRVALEHGDDAITEALGPIQYRLEKELAENSEYEEVSQRPPVAGSPARWMARQDSTDGAASPGGGRRAHFSPECVAVRGPRPAAPAPAPSSSSRRDRHRRRRQQTEAAHKRALARLDRLRLPSAAPNPYAKPSGSKRRSHGSG